MGESAFFAMMEGIVNLHSGNTSCVGQLKRQGKYKKGAKTHPVLNTSSLFLTANTGNSLLHNLPISPNTPSAPYSLLPIV